MAGDPPYGMSDPPPPVANPNAPPPPNRDQVIQKLAEKGLNPQALAQVPDEALAEFCRYSDSLDAPSGGAMGGDANMYGEEPPDFKDDDEKKKFGETCAKMKAYAEKGLAKYADAVTTATDGLVKPAKKDDTMPPEKFAEALTSAVAALETKMTATVKSEMAALRREVTGNFDPIKRDVEKFKEDVSAEQVDAFLSAHLKSGHILPHELDGGAGLPTLRDDLLKADNTKPVHKFAEGGKTIQLTDRQALMERIKRRQPQRFGERFKDPATAQTKETEEVEYLTEKFSENKATFERFGMTSEKLVAGFKAAKKMNPSLTPEAFLSKRNSAA